MKFLKAVFIVVAVFGVVILVTSGIASYLETQRKNTQADYEIQAAQADAEAEVQAQKAQLLNECLTKINEAFADKMVAPDNVGYAEKLQYTQTALQIKESAMQECKIRYSD